MENEFGPAFPEQSGRLSLKVPVVTRLGSAAVDIIIVLLLVYFIPVLGPFIGVAYYLSKDALPVLKGQSLGKKIFKLQVLSQFDETAITKNYRSSFLRSFTLFIPVLNLLELALILLNKHRFGDRWARTFVSKKNPQQDIDHDYLKEPS